MLMGNAPLPVQFSTSCDVDHTIQMQYLAYICLMYYGKSSLLLYSFLLASNVAAETRDNWIACVAYQGEISHCFSLPSASSTLSCSISCMGKQFHLYSQNID
jgi:hypothetical protein